MRALTRNTKPNSRFSATSRARACAACVALVCAVAPPSIRAQETPPNANAILARVKAGIRTDERPPFVAYTLVRRDSLDYTPDFLNSYTLHVWCRTADGAALSRRGTRALGPAEFIVPEFDRPIDPGPPTADLLDVIRQTQGSPPPVALPTASPAPGALVVIGSINVFVERNYHTTFAGIDRGDYHLRLEALRDSDRNRLTDLYVDRTTYAMHRAVAHDHLYTEGRSIPERFEIDFGMQLGVPVIVAIHGETDQSALAADAGAAPFHTVDYRFENITFPPVMPAWYFEPARYGAHRDDLPS